MVEFHVEKLINGDWRKRNVCKDEANAMLAIEGWVQLDNEDHSYRVVEVITADDKAFPARRVVVVVQ